MLKDFDKFKTLFSSVDGIMKFFNETGLADFFQKRWKVWIEKIDKMLGL